MLTKLTKRRRNRDYGREVDEPQPALACEVVVREAEVVLDEAQDVRLVPLDLNPKLLGARLGIGTPGCRIDCNSSMTSTTTWPHSRLNNRSGVSGLGSCCWASLAHHHG
jgi:hypothetical protein